jgi:hypothetical protein
METAKATNDAAAMGVNTGTDKAKCDISGTKHGTAHVTGTGGNCKAPKKKVRHRDAGQNGAQAAPEVRQNSGWGSELQSTKSGALASLADLLRPIGSLGHGATFTPEKSAERLG